MPANIPAETNRYSLEEDYERILRGESLSDLIPIHTEHIKAFREIEGRAKIKTDKARLTGLPVSTIKKLSRVYERHQI